MTSCRLCRKESVPPSAFCKSHLLAKKNVESGYRQWAVGYGGSVSWQDYLRSISKNGETGQWAREVAELLAKESVE